MPGTSRDPTAPLVAALVCAAFVSLATSAAAQEAGALTLADAVARARAHNPDARALAARVDLADADVRIVLARVLPVATLAGTYTRHDSEVRQGSSTIVPGDELGLTGTLSITLFRPRALGDYLVAEKRRDALAADVGWSAEALDFGVVELYVTAALADALRGSAASAAERRAAFLVAAERRLELGQTDRAEVQRARLSLIDARASLRDADAERRVANMALAVLLDLPPDSALSTRGAIEPPETAEDVSSATLNRGDLDAARLDVEADETAQRWAWLTFLPDLALTSSFSRGPESFRDPDGFSWQVELRATLTLYDGGARYGIIDREDASLALHMAELEALEDDVDVEVHAAALRLDALIERRELADEAVEVAKTYHQDVLRKLDAGAATTLDVLDAEEQLSAAEARQQIVAHELALARWRLVRARGQLDRLLPPNDEAP